MESESSRSRPKSNPSKGIRLAHDCISLILKPVETRCIWCSAVLLLHGLHRRCEGRQHLQEVLDSL